MGEPRDYTFYMIGHGHIDPTWLWRWTEGYEEVRATFRSALDRMKESPDVKFTASSACFYAWVKACDPKMYEEIKARVKEGRWELGGGWWLEPDCNVPCGEAIVRHGLYGQRFFEQEFGQRARVGFNPDSFGHAGTFPQILKKLGLEYYVFMRPMAGKEMDYPDGTTFWWQAQDGSAVLTCNLLDTYLGDTDTIDRMMKIVGSPYLNPGQRHVLGFYGVGNHGGGPTKAAIKLLQDADADKDKPKFKFATLSEYMEAFLANTALDDIGTVTTDLQHHARGCYSVHAGVKALNRSTEHALMTAERFAALASLLHDHDYPRAELEKAWKDLLYNQFHDILAGTSLESSYDDSRDQMGAARHAAHFVLNESIQVIARHVDTTADGNTILVFNPLPWPVKQVVTAPPIAARTLDNPIHIVDAQNKVVPHQETPAEYVGAMAYTFTADVPALGYAAYHARSGGKSVRATGGIDAGSTHLENAWWRIELDPYDGQIARLYDKRNKVDVLARGNMLMALADHSDTWSHDVVEYRSETGRFGEASMRVHEAGPVRATLRVNSRYGRSACDQFITIYRECDAIDCVFNVDWHEAYTMLKLGFDTKITDAIATCDTAYGYQERPLDGGEEPCQMWTDLSGAINGKDYGFGVLNTGTYGYDARGGTLRLSLLRSPAYAHHDPARYETTSAHAIMDQGRHTFRMRLAPHAGDWRQGDLVRRAWNLNAPPLVHIESAHKGKLPPRASFLEYKADNVVFSVLKVAEGDSELILRGYETAGKPAKASVRLGQFDQPFVLAFAPHEIKTVCINRKKGTAIEVNMLEEIP